VAGPELGAEMKVIEGPKEWKIDVKCPGCTATLEVGMEDVTTGEFGGNYCEPGDLWVYAPCCVCGTAIKIKELYLAPILVKQRAEKNYRDKKK
jgi:hypothetical protein